MRYRTRNIVTGILLIALAVCLILWKLNVLNLPPVFVSVSPWGLVIAAIMVVVIVHSIIDLSFGGVFVPLAVICIIFDKPLGITAITPWTVLIAAVLLTVAFHMLFPHHRRHHDHSHGGNNRFSDKYSESYSENDNGTIYYSTQFGSSTRYVRSRNLSSAELSSRFGELSVFFDKAEVPGKTVNIDCRVSFGAMNVYIPAEWKVENRVGVTLGHCDIDGVNPNNADDTITCNINGSVAFGELKLIRV
ncbi:MAG: hypothetical protein K5668_11935 [Lachnospiraceae bacterium]|nr:hypothetical protein [Lachnospiraceae bacterium]